MYMTIPTVIKNDQKLTSFQLSFLIILICPISVLTQVAWVNYPDIRAGQVSIYTATSLIVDLTPAANFTQPFTLSSTTNPVAGAIGISAFQIPETHDFALITNKSISTTVFNFSVQVSDQSAFYILTMNYIVMFSNNAIYRMLSKEYYCQKINQGIGYRSEFDIISPSTAGDSFFTTTDIESTLVLQGFRLINTQGTYTFLGVTVNIPTAGKINTTFYTYEENAVYFIQYSILFYKRTVAYQDQVELFDVGYANFTFNNTLVNIFFNSIDTRYTAASGRMFFGLREFNFTYLNNKKFQLSINSYSNLTSGYVFSSDSLVRIRLSYYFFVKRTCTGTTYFYMNSTNSSLDNCYASCSSFGDRPVPDATTTQCLSCHFSCLSCSGLNSNDCITCSSDNHRAISGSTCPCASGYVDNGASLCIKCASAMVGCSTCSGTTTCISCLTGFAGSTTCTCNGTIVSGFCNKVYGCTSISDINGTQLCTACNENLYLQLAANFTCICIKGTTTQSNLTCRIDCGDKYVLTQEGCDDGNLQSGDGCSSLCAVEKNWACVGSGSAGSTCKISTVPNLQYIGIERITSQNKALLYFTLSPYFAQYTYINYTNLLDSNLINYGFDVQFMPSSKLLVATINYFQNIEGTDQTFILYLNSTKYFWNSSDWATFNLKGVNCQLTFDSTLWMNSVLKYVYLSLVIIAIIVFGASIFFEKWIGLELIQTFQSIFFIFALLKECPFEFSGLIEAIRFSNGYDDILASEYYQIYTLSNPLISLSMEKEFIFNFNIMYLVIICIIIVLVIIGLIKRKYRLQLEQQISKKVNDKLKKLDKASTFIFGRIFLTTVLFCMFKIIFSFCVQLSSETVPQQNFADQINVIAGILAFVIMFGVISFVLYWYLLLPADFSQEQQFMSIKFQNMSFYYPILYLGYQTIFILIISINYHQSLSIFIVLSFQILYLVAIIYLRPYNTLRKFNKLFHNATIAFNQFFLILVTCMVISWNSIIGTPSQSSTNTELAAFCFLILIFLSLAIIMAILRLAMFNKEVNFIFFKKSEVDGQSINESDKNAIKKMINDDKERLVGGSIPENAAHSYKENVNESSFRRQAKNDLLADFDDSKIDAFLQENEKMTRKENKTRQQIKRGRSKIKSSIMRKAELPKTNIQTYIEMKNFQANIEKQKDHF